MSIGLTVSLGVIARSTGLVGYLQITATRFKAQSHDVKVSQIIAVGFRLSYRGVAHSTGLWDTCRLHQAEMRQFSDEEPLQHLRTQRSGILK